MGSVVGMTHTPVGLILSNRIDHAGLSLTLQEGLYYILKKCMRILDYLNTFFVVTLWQKIVWSVLFVPAHMLIQQLLGLGPVLVLRHAVPQKEQQD